MIHVRIVVVVVAKHIILLVALAIAFYKWLNNGPLFW